jgi:hypothetical protein
MTPEGKPAARLEFAVFGVFIIPRQARRRTARSTN